MNDQIEDRIQEDADVAHGKVTSNTTPVENPKIVFGPEPEVVTEKKPEVQVSDEMVSVKASVLQNLLDRVDTLEKATPSSELQIARDGKKPKELPSAFLKVLNGKIVIGWKSEGTELLYNPMNPNSVIGEVLKAKYFFLDGTDSGVIDQVIFTRANDRMIVRILSDSGKSVKVKFERLETADDSIRDSLKIPTEVLEIRKDFLNP